LFETDNDNDVQAFFYTLLALLLDVDHPKQAFTAVVAVGVNLDRAAKTSRILTTLSECQLKL